MTRIIQVKAAPSIGERVGLSERHVDHPAGEVYVAGQESPPVKVAADTPGVLQALERKQIVPLEGEALQAAMRVSEAAEQRRAAAREEARLAANPEGDAAKLTQAQERLEKLEAQLGKLQAESEKATHTQMMTRDEEAERGRHDPSGEARVLEHASEEQAASAAVTAPGVDPRRARR